MSTLPTKVVERIAEAEETEPTELDVPLHTAVDTDALDTIFDPTDDAARERGKIQFHYCGYRVTVSAQGEVALRGPD